MPFLAKEGHPDAIVLSYQCFEMKYIVFFTLLSCSALYAQEKINPTNALLITGKVLREKTVTLSEIVQLPAHKIGDVIVTNHLGVTKGTAKNMKGVLLKDLLDSNCFAEPVPRKLSEFYITCSASDGYQVVFSWNEIFNTETGNHIFLVTEKEGRPIAGMEERILLVVPTDQKTGRRYIKGLSKIIINRAG